MKELAEIVMTVIMMLSLAACAPKDEPTSEEHADLVVFAAASMPESAGTLSRRLRKRKKHGPEVYRWIDPPR